MKKIEQLLRLIAINKKFSIIMIVSIFFTLAEAGSVALFAPMVSMMSNKEGNQLNLIHLNNLSVKDTMIINGLLIVALIVALSIIKSKCLSYITKNSQVYRHLINIELLNNYIENNNDGMDIEQKRKILLVETDNIVNFLIMPIFFTLSYSVAISLIVAFLFFININATMSIIIYSLIIYGVITKVIKNKAIVTSSELIKINQKRFEIVNDILNGLLEIKLYKKTEKFIEWFRAPSIKTSQLFSETLVLSQMPRFIIEAMTLAGIIIFALIALNEDGHLPIEIISTFALFTLAIYKIMPLLQGVISNITSIRMGLKSFDLAKNHFIKTKDSGASLVKIMHNPNIVIHSLTVKDQSGELIIKIENFEIESGKKYCIVGRSGSGKSTLLRALGGLQELMEIKCDLNGVNISNVGEYQHCMQHLIAYVPQSQYILRVNAIDNITLLVPNGDYDPEKMLESIEISGLKNQWERIAKYGDVKILSGGEKQRLTMARALYHDRKIILMDEPTSALDVESANELYKFIELNRKGNTIIVVTHDRNMEKIFDHVIELKNKTAHLIR